MRGHTNEPEEPLLFDLPLEIPERKAERRRGERKPKLQDLGPTELEEPFLELTEPAAASPVNVSRPHLAYDKKQDGTRDSGEQETGEEDDVDDAPDGHATVGNRLAAAGADLLIHAAVAVTLVAGTRAMGVRPSLEEWPAVLLFLVVFSFLYAVVPLAFWGHTLGMAWAGLTSRNRDGEPLTFDQTTRRWAGGMLTLATLGVPLLFARRGRALSDLLSGSETYSATAFGGDLGDVAESEG
jgi:RDD family